MVARVIENIVPKGVSRLYLIARSEHANDALACAEGCTVIAANGATEGAACTVLLARDIIDNDDPMIIANGDQLVDMSIADFIGESADAGIVTFRASGPKWSYVLTNKGLVVEVAEKREISDLATAGIYFWRRGSDFVKSADAMIAAKDRTNGEFYVAPSFNYFDGAISSYEIPASAMHPLGTPEDLEAYIASQSEKAA